MTGMQLNDVTPERLRRLAETTAGARTVLSVYLNLDPREFATPPARESAIRSVLDAADRRVREQDDLSHDEKKALREGVERLGSYFADEFSAKGAHGLGLFVSEPDGLFEVVRLPRPVDSDVSIGDRPHIEPLTRVGARERWAVVLVSRSGGRLLRGSADRLEEVADLSEDVHGQHDQGGWSQARYERSVDEDARAHVRTVLEALGRSDAKQRFDRLLIAAPDEVFPYTESQLEHSVRERFAGRIGADVAEASPGEVMEAARPLMAEDAQRRERALLDRLSDAQGVDGRAATSLEEVLDALVQRRVEALLVGDTYAAPGVACRSCGWLGTSGDECPVDGQPLEHADDIVERAVEAAIQQDAEVVFVRHYDDLDAHGGIAAVRRF